MADYVNHQFECFIPEKDVEENLLILQPVPENVRGVKKLDDFVKSILGQSAQVLNQDTIKTKFLQKILDVLGPFSRLWKGLEDIKNAPDDTVSVPVEDHIKLIEQTILLLGQASNSILYSQCLQILKTLIKDPKKAKNILKEKADLLQKGNQNLFGKKFKSHVVEIERSKKRTLEVFSGGNHSPPPAAKRLFRTGPFRQALHRTATNRMVEGNFTTVKNRTIETDITRNMVENKTTNGAVMSQVSKVLDQEQGPLFRKFSELIPGEFLTNVRPLVKNLFTGKIPNLQLAGRLAHFIKNWEKLTQDQEILSVVKGYVIPFLKVPVQRNIPKQVTTSKTQEILINQEIMEMLDKG